LKIVIPKIVPKATSNFCYGFPSLSLVDSLQCTFMAGFQNVAFKLLLKSQLTGGYRKDGTSFMKRVIGRIFTISHFIEAETFFS
jgi:hypothetical protein